MQAPSAIRAALAEAIEAIEGWRESRWPPGLFGSDPQDVAHLAFVVDPVETIVAGDRQQQRAGTGVWVHSAFVIRWAHRSRGDASRSDLADMLDAEQVLLATVRSITAYDLTLDRITRDTSQEGYTISVVRFICHHFYPLT